MTACGGDETTSSNETEDGQNVNEQESAELQNINVVLDWTPNTNHTGIYVAQSQGYFAEEGLNVSIIQPGDAGAETMVAANNAQFGISYQENVTNARSSSEIPIVSIAAIIQHNTSGFASLAEKNITSPKDFANHTYGGWGSPAEEPVIASLMQTEQANIEDVEFVNIGNSDFFAAMESGIDLAWIYYAWTGIEAELRGVDINVVYLNDYEESLDYYTPVIITSEDTVNNDPALASSFMAAVSKGYAFAIEQPEQAAEILIEAEPDLDPELVKASQKWLADKYQDDAEQWGLQKKEVWVNYASWLEQNELLEGSFDAEAAFTNQFLPQ